MRRSATAKDGSHLRGSWLNIHDLHAGGASHGRGMKRLPCPRPTRTTRGDAGCCVSSWTTG